MTITDADILNELSRAIAQKLPGILGEGIRLESPTPLRTDRRYSFLFHYRLSRPDGTSLPVLVKIPREEWMGSLSEAIGSDHLRGLICEEYERLSAIAKVIARANHPALSAIQPLAVFPEFNALLLEELPMRMLKTYLLQPAIMLGLESAWQPFDARVEHAAKWIRVLHAAFNTGRTATLERLGMPARLAEEFASLEKFTGSQSGLRSEFQSLYAAISAVEIPLTCLHNDFHLGNIYTTDGQVGALDPNWAVDKPAYEDLATLLVDPFSRKLPVLSQGLLFRSSLQQRYTRAVLRGYSGNPASFTPLLAFHCALKSLIKWKEDEEVLASHRSFLYKIVTFFMRPLLRRYFKRLVRGYLRQGMEALQNGSAAPTPRSAPSSLSV